MPVHEVENIQYEWYVGDIILKIILWRITSLIKINEFFKFLILFKKCDV